jgi:hypothetical protein
MNRTRRRVIATGAAGASAAAAAFAIAIAAHGAAPRTGPLLIRSALERPPRPFVRGNDLFDAKGGRHRLNAAVSGALMGPLSPVAVSEPGSDAIAYSSWQKLREVDPQLSLSKQGIGDGDPLGVPSLRVRDASGHDVLLERGAYSAAWRPDGAIAYFKGGDAEFRAGRPYVGDLYVRSGVHGRTVRWTSETAHYTVYAWAGDRLLFYRVGDGETLSLLSADAPGRVRELAEGSAVALSPDGRRVMVLSPDGTTVRVLDVGTGREQAWLDVTTASPALRWVGYSGSWTGDRVVAPASGGLAVFRVGSDSIALEQALSLDAAQFPAGVQEPQFAGGGADEITATADVPPKDGDGGVAYFLDCDRVARSCGRSAAAPATDWPRLVSNPSRPGGDR